MNKLLILLILLSYSCTTDIRSDFSNQRTYLLMNNKYVENKKIQYIYNRVLKSIRPDMPIDSLKEVLQNIHYCDQIYRDSLMEGNTWISDEVKRAKYWKQITPMDKMNQRILVYLLNNIGGRPDTKDMGEKASEAIWLVIHHNSGTKEFSQQVLPYLNKAYYSDKVIDNNRYAGLFDEVNYTVNGHTKYGTYGYNKEFHHDSVRTKINLERIKLGLAKL